MLRYLLRTPLRQSLVLLLLVSVIGFAVLNLAPGGPLSQFTLTPGMTQAEISIASPRKWGSITSSCPVHRLAGTPASRGLGALVPGRQACARHHLGAPGRDIAADGRVDRDRHPCRLLDRSTGRAQTILRSSTTPATVGAMVALSIPTFWFGLMVIFIFAERLDWIPSGGRETLGAPVSLSDRLAPSHRPGAGVGARPRRHLEPLHPRRDAGNDQPGLRADSPR